MADTRRKRPRDSNQLAKLVVDIATGAVEDSREERDAGGYIKGRWVYLDET